MTALRHRSERRDFPQGIGGCWQTLSVKRLVSIGLPTFPLCPAMAPFWPFV
jgi:hypothetical protein